MSGKFIIIITLSTIKNVVSEITNNLYATSHKNVSIQELITPVSYTHAAKYRKTYENKRKRNDIASLRKLNEPQSVIFEQFSLIIILSITIQLEQMFYW